MRQVRELPDLSGAARPRVDDGQLIVAEGQRVQRGAEAVGDERDHRTVGGPCRLEIGVRIIGQAPQLATLQIVRKEIGHPSDLRAEGDHFSVGRPRRIKDLPERRELDLLDEVAVVASHDPQRRVSRYHGAEHEPAAVGVPRACGVDELQALEMRIARRRDELADGASVFGIGEVDVDGKQTGVRHVDEATTVRAQCRREVVVLLFPRAHEQTRSRGGRRQQPRLHPLRAVRRQRDARRQGDRLRRIGKRAMPIGDETVGRPVRHLLQRELDVATPPG